MTVSGLAAVTIPSSAATVTRASSAATDVTSRPDAVSAQLAARLSGHRVAVSGSSTPTSSTWANPDGTMTKDVFSEPVQAKDTDGVWKPLDQSLQQRSNRTLAPRLSAAGTEFAAAGSPTAARLAGSTGSVGLDWLANLPSPTIGGATATYPNVLAGTDLTATATSTGFELSLVVRAKTKLPTSVSLPLRGTGLVWALSGGGLLTGADAAGKVVVTSSGAQVFDATTDPVTGLHTHSAPLTLTLTGKPGAQRLVVALPANFLADPATVYPVTIDPSTSWAKSAWAFVDAAAGNTVFYNTSSTGRVGPWDAAGTHKSRSFYTFATAGLAGKYITAASFKINESSAQDCIARPFEVWSTTPLTTTTTYNDQPAWGTHYATITSNAGGGTACPAAQVSGDITLWAQHVLTGGYTEATLGIKVATAAESTQAYFKQFGVVSVSVTYDNYPSSVSQLSVSPCAGGCPTSGTRYVGSSRPTFSSYATDADSSQLAHYFSIQSASDSSTDLVTGHDTTAPSGSLSWQVPVGNELPDGDYTYKAWAYDGTVTGPVSTPVPFTIDATAPSPPTISSTTQPAGGLTTGSTLTFTLAGTTSDTTLFAYKLETGVYSGWVAAGTVTVSNVTTDSLHTLSVIAMDRAGNVSTPATYGFGGGLTSPADQDRTQHYVTLSAGAPSTYPDVAYQWRRGTTDPWAAIPMADVAGATSSNWPVGPIATAYTWDLASTAGGADGLYEVRACLYVSTTDPSPACLEPVDVTLAAMSFGDSKATSALGPGTVSLLTGDFQVSASDVSVPSFNGSLSIGRTLTTLADPIQAPGPTGVFGPGWRASLPGTDAGAGDSSLDDETADGYIDIVDSDGSATTYQATTPVGSYPITFTGVGEAAADASVLTKVNATTVTLAEADGTVTTWTSSSNGWLASKVQEAGSQSATSYTRDSAGLVTRILAPVPAGIDCTAPDTTPGCRSLKLTYTTLYFGRVAMVRLQTVTFVAWDPQANAMASVDVAAYDYDVYGNLAHAWDPRISPNLLTAYTYDAPGRLSTITPPGQATWTLHYDTGHRISSVTRPDPSGATATSTVVYGLPLTGSGLPDLSPTSTATWGQASDQPILATAVFGPDHVPAATPTSSDWPYASISYLDANGRQVNTAQYGAGQWLIDTTRYDTHGNTIWSLTAGNRAQALAPTADTDPAAAAAASSVDRANLLSSKSVYTADGTELLDSYDPVHPVRLANGTLIDARSHTHTDYDQGAPSTDGPYQLPTTSTTSAQGLDGTDYDQRVTTTGYAIINSSDPNEKSGWALRQATSTTTQLGATPDPSVDLVRITRYNGSGQLIESRLPAAASGGAAGDTVTSYYTAAGTGPCVSAGQAGLLCSTGPAVQPSTGNPLPVTTTTYNLYDEVLTLTETAGSTVRTTTTGYDSAGRTTSSAISVTPASAGGTALPAVTTGYDSTTGLPTTVSAGGSVLTTGYDNLGQETSYTDAGGNTSTTGYDISGQVVSVSDGKGTYGYTYDSATEHRGVLTSEDLGVGSVPGTISVDYDLAGNAATVTYPNGLTATTSYDNTGTDTALVYAKDGATWLSFTQTPGSDGNTAAQTSPASSQLFSYDGAGRLVQTRDTVPDPVAGTVACTTRVYALDRNSNRLSLNSYPDAGTDPTTGTCATSTTPTTWTGSYDQADRVTTTGYSYDTLGRTLSVPAADAQGIGSHAGTTGSLSVGYYANDFVASQTQATRTLGFTLDPLQNRVIDTTDTAGTTSTNHYSDDSDSPAWTGTPTGWSRNLIGPAGLVGSVDQSGAVTLDMVNPHGDVVATCADDPAATGTTSYSESTEFGAPRVAASAPDSYGWLGAKRRSADDLGGIVLMGVRLYNPATGRFLSSDPVPGGTDNPYVYVTDPLDTFDLNGQQQWRPSLEGWRVWTWLGFRKKNKHFVLRDHRPALHFRNHKLRLEFDKDNGWHINYGKDGVNHFHFRNVPKQVGGGLRSGARAVGRVGGYVSDAIRGGRGGGGGGEGGGLWRYHDL